MIVKLASNKKGKIIVIEKRNKRQKTTKSSKYEKYVAYARQSKLDYILTESDYKTTEVRNRNKGIKVSPKAVVRWQLQGERSDKQIKAMWNAAKLRDPNLTRAQFIREKGWENIDREAEDLYKEIQSTERYQTVKAEIEKLEEKRRDSKLDLLDSRRLRLLREERAAMLHIISQQIYGSL